MGEDLQLASVTDNRDLAVFPTSHSPAAQARLQAHKETTLQEMVSLPARLLDILMFREVFLPNILMFYKVFLCEAFC